jgi:acyl carrier protein
MTIFDRVKTVASDIFDVAPTSISANSSPENIECWDSVQHLTFILALEEAFQLQFSSEETEIIHTIGDAAKLIEEKLPQAHN